MLPPATWCCVLAKLVWKSWREGWVATSINLTSTQARTSGPAAAHTQPSPCLLFQAAHVLAAGCSRHESPKCRRQLHTHLARTQVVKSPPYPVNMQDCHQRFRAQPAMFYHDIIPPRPRRGQDHRRVRRLRHLREVRT